MRARCFPILLTVLSVTSCEPTSPAEPSSIIFISVDTLSARHTSLHGYERETTPGLDRLAQTSIVFDRCWANAPWTAPSYMSQFTGLQPASFRRPFDGEAKGNLWSLAPQHAVLAELLSDAGYRTAGFVDNLNAGKLFDLDRGFEYFDDSASKRGLEDVSGGIDHVAPLALDWLDGLDGEAPFFLFLQVLDVHGPYLSGSKWDGELATRAVVDRTVPIALTKETTLGAIPKYIADPVIAEGQVRLSVEELIDDYDRGIRAMDEALTDFIAELKSRGLFEKSWLVISADHGESMFEHESYFNHLLLHGEELHVPLIVRPPGGTAGRRVQTNVQLVDLLPSILDMGGLPHPDTLHGRSLLPAITGSQLEPVAVFAFGDFEESRSVIVGDWKLVETNPSLRSAGLAGFFSSPRVRAWLGEKFPELTGKVFGTHELPPDSLTGVGKGALEQIENEDLFGPFHALFDLKNDAGEEHDVADAHPQRVAELLDLLNREDALARSSYLEFGGTREIDPETRAELESLGYSGEDD